MHTKECPSCKSVMSYSSKGALTTAIKNNTNCRKCTSIKTGFTERYATKGSNTGVNNPFYNKKHNKKTKELLSKQRKGISFWTEETKKKVSVAMSGSNNIMYNRTVMDIWIKKYGEEKAKILEKKWKKKISEKTSGKNNPMYGKPSPQGSGNGWKGWYKNIYFRSLRELSYMIWLDENNIIWESNLGLRIPYIFNGNNRTYTPDFLIDDTYIEIKPKRLHNTPLVLVKTKAIKEYCKKNKLKFKIIDCDIDIIKIRQNIDNKNVVFNRGYLERFEKYEETYNSKRGSVVR